jgi:hypothetical protein
MENVTISTEFAVYHVPMCVICGEKEVNIVVNSAGSGYCSPECEASYNEADDEPFGAMSERYAEYDEERKLEGDMDEPFDRDMRDDEAALESVYGPEDDGGYDDFNDWG